MAYSYYRAITIDHTKCGSADSSDFPVLISGTYTYLKTVGNGGKVQSSSGYDIQFYSDSALTTALKFERVVWGASTGTVEFWVKVPTLSASSDTVIYMAYGNSAVTTDQQDAANTWSNGFVGVWHLGDGSTLGLSDSTSNALSLTNNSATATTGQIAGGAALSGSSQYLTGGTNSALDLTGDLTFSAWVKPTSLSNYNGVLSRCNSNIPDPYDWYIIASGEAGKGGKLRFYGGDGSLSANVDGTTAISTGVWSHVAVKMSSTTCTHYVNGATAGSGTLSQSRTGHTRTLYVGNRADNATMFGGSLDEIRIANVARGTEWLLSEYNNQNSPSTFYTVGSETSSSVSDVITVTAAHLYARPQTVNMPASYAVPVTAAHVYARGQTVGVNLSSPLAVSAAHVYARGQTVNMPAAYSVPITAAHVYARGQTVNMPGAASIAVTAAHVYARGQTVNISAAYTVPITAAHVYARGQTITFSSTTGTTIVVDGANVYARGQGVGFTASVKTVVDGANVYARPQTVGMSAARTIVVDGASYIVRGQSVGVACQRVISVTNGTVIVRGQDILITDTVTSIVLVAPLYVEIASASYSVACEQTERAVSCDNSQYICT